ncbi:DUF4232 domain-containing protein, partial [Acidimicrobiaceae bacterium USS-CC1]|nr:DUF4232 domain-containing protein [Acidiferrimicrobium australe]
MGAAVDPATGGYWLVTEAGNVYNFHAPWYGSLAGRSLSSPVVAMTATATGYLVTTAAGNVYNFHTPWYGSKAGAALPASVTAITVDPYTGGYWLATTGGNVYNFHAPWYGSAVGKGHADVSGIVGTPTGYLLTTTAGNVYNFHTPFHGSLANRSLTAPITGVTADPAVHGSYWLAAATGAVYPFAAPDYGRAHTRTIAACNGTELLVTAGSTGAVLGHDGDYLSFTNTGSQPCSLTGYPGVAALGANGQQILQATRTPNGHLGGLRPGNTIAPTVILA